MQNDHALTGPVMRLFEARAKEGCADELARNLATTSVDVVRDVAGNEGYFFGRGVGDDDGHVMFASLWKDLDSVKSRFGEDWQTSYLPEGYPELIAESSVRHYFLASGQPVESTPLAVLPMAAD